MASNRAGSRNKLTGLRLNKFVLSIWRRVFSCVLLVAFCVSSVPVPFESAEPLVQDSSERFPCEGHRCGCKTAHQCWTNCCCNSPKQRVAWAKRNNIQPPAYAVLSDPDETESDRFDRLRKNVAKKSAAEDYCGTSKCGHCDNQKKPKENSERTATGKKKTFVLSMLALRCQGKSSAMTSLPWLVPTIRPDVEIRHTAPEPYGICVSSFWFSFNLEPETPPPKAFLV
jgi:hypothetical protein